MGRQPCLCGPIVPFSPPQPQRGEDAGVQHHAGGLPWHFPANTGQRLPRCLSPLCLLPPEHHSLGTAKLLPAPGAASLPSCRSSELVEQPLGKEAAGRNKLTWCQPRWHSWSSSKGAFHLPSATLKWDFPTRVTWTKRRITSFAANLLFCSCCYGKYLCVVCVEKFLLCSAASPFASPCSKSSLG